MLTPCRCRFPVEEAPADVPYPRSVPVRCRIRLCRIASPARCARLDPGVPRQWPRALDLLRPGPGGWLNHMPKNCFNDVLPAGAVATMSARASESAMTAK